MSSDLEHDAPDSATSLSVAEMFHSVQGEGPYAGTPAVFLRTGGCNLLCGAPDDPTAPQEELEPNEEEGATWVCDTIEVWRNGDGRSIDDLVEEWDSRGWLTPLRRGSSNLVLTGGEPMLEHRADALVELVETVQPNCLEVETNGTIPLANHPFASYPDQYNVSLKLSNSGMDYDRRINPTAVQQYAADDRATFKFVVSREQDLREIHDLREEYHIPATDVMLMPAGASQDDLAVTSDRVADLCIKYGYRYSPRLQVTIWNEATGV